MMHIHSSGHCHLNINTDKIHLDKNLNAKIADVGLSRSNMSGIQEDVGNKFNRAPEICRKEFPCDGEKADVFALAVVLFTMVYKVIPTEDVKNVTSDENYQMFCTGDLD